MNATIGTTTAIMTSTTTAILTTLPPTPPTFIPDEHEPYTGSYGAFYTVAIFLGVIGLPAVIMFRVCWVRRMNARYQQQIAEGRHHNHPRDPDNPEVFTVDVDPESYLPTYEQSVADSPPSYDQIVLKKNPSSSSLPQYSAEDPSLRIDTSVTSHPVENVLSHPERNNQSVSSTPGCNNT